MMAVLMVLSVSHVGAYASEGSVINDAADVLTVNEVISDNELRDDDLIKETGIFKPDDTETVLAEDDFAEADLTGDVLPDGFSSDGLSDPEERYFGYIENDFYVDMPEDGSLVTDEGYDETGCETGIEICGEDISADAAKEITVPSKYTLNDNKYVSSVKDQGAWGTCWAFMAMAAAESAYMRQNPGSEINMSETQMIKYFYNGYYGEDIDRGNGDGTLRNDRIFPNDNIKPVMMGGNADFTTFALARWTGAADEAYDPSLGYPTVVQTERQKDVSVAKGLAYDADAEHLQNAYWIDIKNKTDIKKAIIQYGAAGAAYYNDDIYSSDYYKKKINSRYSGPAVYYNCDEKNTLNHEVVIVGWDDDFDRYNFRFTYKNALSMDDDGEVCLPSSNGAWLVKNSEGTGYGDRGFVWISYEDLALNKDGRRAYVFDFEEADNYTHNYQYDGSCYTSQKIYPYVGAVYKASGQQQVEAVGIGFASADNNYTVSVYKDIADPSDPESGDLAVRKSGSTTYPGFYTVILDEFADIDAGSMFSIVVKSRTKDNGFTSFFTDTSHNFGDGYRFNADLTNDKTFYRTENTDWLSSSSRDLATVRLKAYANDRPDHKKTLDGFTVELPRLTYNGLDRTQELSDGLVVKENGKVLRDTHYTYEFDRLPCEAGSYRLIVSGKNDYEGTREFVFVIDKARFSAEDVSLEYTETYYNTLEQRPAVYVKIGQERSRADNYDVIYTDNINCGTATVTVTGKNSLQGNAVLTFKINRCPISRTTVVVDQVIYTGEPLTPAVTVALGSYKLNNIIDYTLTYSNNIEASDNALVTITGCGNFIGTKEHKFTIYAETIPRISVIGKAGTALASVKYGNTLLDPSCYDLEIYYGKERVRVDKFEATKTYTVRVKLKGNYSGDFIVTDVKVNVDSHLLRLRFKKGDSVFYNGKAQKPAVEMVDENGNIVPSKYYKLAYIDNVEVGTATVTATCKGLYSGFVSAMFTIRPAIIEPSMITAVKDKKFTGSAITPQLKIKGLKAGRDYICSYSNNVNVSYDSSGNIIKGAAITIVPSSNYTFAPGFDGTCYFKILPVAISSVKASDGYYRGEGRQVVPSSITVKAGKYELNEDDYTVRYSNNTSLSKKAVATVTVKNGGNFTGKKSAKYRLVKENVKTMTVLGLEDRDYTGRKIRPSVIVINSYGEMLVKGKDYKLKYGKNVKPGDGTVKIIALDKSIYTGNVTKIFKIVDLY